MFFTKFVVNAPPYVDCPPFADGHSASTATSSAWAAAISSQRTEPTAAPVFRAVDDDAADAFAGFATSAATLRASERGRANGVTARVPVPEWQLSRMTVM